MGISNFPKTINFTTSNADYELLQDANIKNALKDALGRSEEEYQKLLLDGISNLYFDILISNTRISVENTPYEHGELLSNAIYSSGDYVRRKIKSIRVEDNGVSGTFSFNIL